MQLLQEVIGQYDIVRCYLHMTHETGIGNIPDWKLYEGGVVCCNAREELLRIVSRGLEFRAALTGIADARSEVECLQSNYMPNVFVSWEYAR